MPTVAILAGRQPEHRYSLQRGYVDAVWALGAVPVVLTPPPLDATLDDFLEVVVRCDGVLISGGGDVDPRAYGEVRVEPLDRFPPEVDEIWRAAAPSYGNHVIRDAEFLNWRYADTPRTYRRFGAYGDERLRAVAIVGHTVKQGVSSGFLADLVSEPGADAERVALLRRAAQELEADALIALPPRAQRGSFLRAGFLPTNRRIRFVGKILNPDGRLDPSPAAWHFTLGDFDFF